MNTISAGRIEGNPLCGLCNRVCVQTKRVFDGCVSRTQNESLTAVLTDFTPGTVPPFTFRTVTSYGEAVFSVLSMTPEGDRCRVRGDLTVPIVVTYCDGNNNMGSARSQITFVKDVLLRIPRESLLPYAIEPEVRLTGSIGAFLTDNTVNFTSCNIQILRVVASVDLLVPSYGYARYPLCRGETDACNNLFETPLFPDF